MITSKKIAQSAYRTPFLGQIKKKKTALEPRKLPSKKEVSYLN
jgi:hypothetical protein